MFESLPDAIRKTVEESPDRLVRVVLPNGQHWVFDKIKMKGYRIG